MNIWMKMKVIKGKYDKKLLVLRFIFVTLFNFKDKDCFFRYLDKKKSIWRLMLILEDKCKLVMKY